MSSNEYDNNQDYGGGGGGPQDGGGGGGRSSFVGGRGGRGGFGGRGGRGGRGRGSFRSDSFGRGGRGAGRGGGYPVGVETSNPDHGSNFVPGAGPEQLAPKSLDHFKRGYQERADTREKEYYSQRSNDRTIGNRSSFSENNGGAVGGRHGSFSSDNPFVGGRGGRGSFNSGGGYSARLGSFNSGPAGRQGSFSDSGNFNPRGSFNSRSSFNDGNGNFNEPGGGFGNSDRFTGDPRGDPRDRAGFNRRGSTDAGAFNSAAERVTIVCGLDIGELLNHLENVQRDVPNNTAIFGELDHAMEKYPEAFRSGKALTALISGSARRRNVRLAYAIWDWLNRQQHRPDGNSIRKNTYHYNSMITVAATARKPQMALELMNEMSREGIEKNEVTFSSAITACEKSGDWRTAIELLDRMEGDGLARTAISFNAAISACEKGMVPQKACEVFQRMRKEGIRPSVVTYSALISAAEKGGQWKLALEILDDMKKDGFRANVIAYSAAISALAKGQQWEKALELFREVQNCGRQPSIVTYNATMTALEKGLQWERALDLFDEMKMRNLPITVVSYGSALSACDKGLQYRQCLEFLDEMTEMGIQKNVIIFGAAMSCMEKCSRADICFQLMERMKLEGVAPNVHIYNSVISACARSNLWEKGYELFKEMEIENVKRDVVTYNAVLDAVSSQIKLGRMLFEEGVKQGFYARVSRLAKHWFELDLHFLSLGGGEIALGWWFEECLVPYLGSTEKLKDVKSISIVTGYGKTRTRGRRQGDDGMRKRVKAMLEYMNIKELDQPNLGRIHIDIEALIKTVTENGGKIIFDIESYTSWKDANFLNNPPDVEQKIRPRYKPEVPGSAKPPFIRIETDSTSPEYRLGPDVQPQTFHDPSGGQDPFGQGRRESWNDREQRNHPGADGDRRGSVQNRFNNDRGVPDDSENYTRGSFTDRRGSERYERDDRPGPRGSFRQAGDEQVGRGSFRANDQAKGEYDRPYRGAPGSGLDDEQYGPPRQSVAEDQHYGGANQYDDQYGGAEEYAEDGSDRKRDFSNFKQQQARGYNLEPDNRRRRQF